MTTLLIALFAFAVVLGITAGVLVVLRRTQAKANQEHEMDEDRPTQVES